jgi:UDP-glucuronate 4-epimerase
METVLVTGAAGFIGSFLSRELLARGYRVIGIDNFSDYYPRQAKELNLKLIEAAKSGAAEDAEAQPVFAKFQEYYNWSAPLQGEFKFLEGDIRDAKFINEIFETEKPTKVVHLAAMAGVDLSTTNPLLYVDVNILGSTVLLEAARTHGVTKFVFGSSSSVYGEREEVPFRETDNVDEPISPYAATKRMQEILNYTYNFLYGLPILNVRIFGPIYGPLQRPYRMLAQRFINLAYHDKPMTIFGDGNEGARDTTYIDDEVTGIVLALESDLKYETINVGSGRTVSPQQVADTIIELLGKGEVTYVDRPRSEAPITFADTQKAKQLLGFEAKWEFKDGLSRQIEIFKLLPDWYKQMQT